MSTPGHQYWVCRAIHDDTFLPGCQFRKPFRRAVIAGEDRVAANTLLVPHRTLNIALLYRLSTRSGRGQGLASSTYCYLYSSLED
jgi:hypothetical protein